MNLFYYLFEANAYLLGLYLFYRIALKNETFHSLNRIFLLGGSVLAFILPAVTLGALKKSGERYVLYVTEKPVEHTYIDSPETIAVMLYVLVLAALFVKLLVRINHIRRLIHKGTTTIQHGFKQVAIKGHDFPFSFLNYVFLDPSLPKIETILRHEKVHIRQMHSADILFLEMLKIFNWFSPVPALIQKELKALHEFIADEKTACEEPSASDYAVFLINSSYGMPDPALSHPIFSKTLLKKRLEMLNRQRSAPASLFKYGFLLVLIPLMLGTSASVLDKDYSIIDMMPAQDTTKKVSKTLPPPPPAMPAKKLQSKIPPPPPAPKKAKNYYILDKSSGQYKKVDPSTMTAEQKRNYTPPPPPPPAMPAKKSQSKIPPPPPAAAPVKRSQSKLPPPPPPPPPVPRQTVPKAPASKSTSNNKSAKKFPPPVVVEVKNQPASAKKFPPPVVVEKKNTPATIKKFPPPIVVIKENTGDEKTEKK